MSRDLLRPKRPLRYELYSLVAVLSVPVALLLAFPRAAVGFKAAPDVPRHPAGCAFVVLSEEEEQTALSNARAAWKVNAEGVRSLRADLSVEAMPDEAPHAVMSLDERTRAPQAKPLAYGISPMPPSLAAPRPVRISAPTDADEGLAFPRKQLLNID